MCKSADLLTFTFQHSDAEEINSREADKNGEDSDSLEDESSENEGDEAEVVCLLFCSPLQLQNPMEQKSSVV